MKKTRSSRHGFSNSNGGWAIVGTMIAIVVGLIMLGGIFVVVRQSMDSSRANDALTQLQTIRMNTKQVFSSESSFNALGTDGTTGNTIGLNAGVFPDSMKKGAGAGGVKNPWNGNVTLRVVAAVPTRFTITMEDIPKDACMKIGVSKDWLSVSRDSESGLTVQSVTNASANCQDTNTLVFMAD